MSRLEVSGMDVLFVEKVGGRVPTGFGCIFPVGLGGGLLLASPVDPVWERLMCPAVGVLSSLGRYDYRCVV